MRSATQIAQFMAETAIQLNELTWPDGSKVYAEVWQNYYGGMKNVTLPAALLTYNMGQERIKVASYFSIDDFNKMERSILELRDLVLLRWNKPVTIGRWEIVNDIPYHPAYFWIE